jgi:hypothetical protein
MVKITWYHKKQEDEEFVPYSVAESSKLERQYRQKMRLGYWRRYVKDARDLGNLMKGYNNNLLLKREKVPYNRED